MASPARDWIGAASCCEGPRPAATFADLPKAHKGEVLRFAVTAACSTAFFVALGVLSRSLPSRSLAGQVGLPDAVVARAVVLDAHPGVIHDRPFPRRPVVHVSQERSAYQLASLEEPVAEDDPVAPPAPRPERHRNIFSRFFRGVFRTASTAPPRPDIP